MKKWLLQTMVLALSSLAVAVGINAVRTDGIPLIRPTPAEMALREGVTPIHLDTARLLLKDPKVLFLDARPERSYKRGRIPGSTSFPEDQFAAKIQAFQDSVPLDRPLVAYCDGIECRASEMLAKELKDRGYKYIYLFFGGWTEWRDSGERIEK